VAPGFDQVSGFGEPEEKMLFRDSLRSSLLKRSMKAFCTGLPGFDDRIKALDRKIAEIFKASDVSQRIAKIRRIGPKTATAMIAAPVAAWLGFGTVPTFERRSHCDDGY
jgi:transposase